MNHSSRVLGTLVPSPVKALDWRVLRRFFISLSFPKSSRLELSVESRIRLELPGEAATAGFVGIAIMAVAVAVELGVPIAGWGMSLLGMLATGGGKFAALLGLVFP